MLLHVFLLLILAICLGFLWGEGMWGIALRLICVLLAALVATNFWEPVADFLNDLMPSWTYVWDFLAVWLIFAVFMLALRLIVDRALSLVKVRFLKIVDQVGSAVLALLVGWVMVGFVTMTLHMAPLGQTFFWGSFHSQDSLFWAWPPTGSGWAWSATSPGARWRRPRPASSPPPTL